MRLITTLSLGAATLALAALGAGAQPLRTAAAEPAVPAVTKTAAPTPQAAFAPAPAVTPAAPPSTVAAATPAPAAAAPQEPQTTSDGIAVTVGENSISDYELEQRVALFFATAGFKPTPDDIKRARKIQTDQLIDERIQIAEAHRRRISVSVIEVDRRIETFAKEHNTTVKELTELLAKAGTSIDVLRAQHTASIAWSKVVVSEYGDSVVVSPAMVDDAMRRAAEGASKTHYHVMELFLPVDSPDKDAAVKKQAEELEAEIRSGKSPFRNLANQYSRNPSAAAGGDIGWVYDGQLDPELNAALTKMRTNEVSAPIRAKGGWYLLGVAERQEALGTDVRTPEPVKSSYPPGTLPLARMLLPLAPGTPPATVENIMRNAEKIREATASCEVMEKISQDPQLQGSVFMNPLQFAKLINPDATVGVIKLSDVSEEMQKALAGTKSGDVAPPFQSPAGIEIIARCDERPPPPRTVFAMPKREDIESDLFQEQISSLARRFMRDLKRNSNIQERNDSAVMDAALVK